MNILLVSRSFFRGGGSASRLVSFTDHLRQKHRVFVLTIVPPNESLDNLKCRNLWVFNCPIKPRLTIIPFFSIVNILLVYLSIRRLLVQLNVNVVIASIPEFEEGVATAVAAKGASARTLVDVGDLIADDHVAAVYGMFPKFFRVIIATLLRKAITKSINSFDKAVTVTQTLREAMVAEGIRVPIDVITNGADTTLFHPPTIESKADIRREWGLNGSFFILYAGAMGVEYYPMDVLVHAFEVAADSFPDAKLVLCGSWNQQMEQMTAKLGDRVKYLGFLKLQDMARVMQACDIGLITMDNRPSTFVALTTKFFEYLASGMPVIAACPKGGELDQVIASEKVGYTVAPMDYKSMAQDIIQLLNNENERQAFAQKGVKLVTTRFDRAKLAETFESALLNIEKSKR